MHLGKMGSRTAAAEVPVTRWEDSGGGKAGDIHLSKHSHTGHLHSLTCKTRDCTKRKALLFSLLVLLMACPFFAELRDRRTAQMSWQPGQPQGPCKVGCPVPAGEILCNHTEQFST